MTTTTTTSTMPVPPPRRRTSWPVRVGRAVAAVLATLLALFVVPLLVGAYVMAVPKAGVIGPVLVGQFPFHVLGLALAGLLLAVVALRAGLRRYGRVLVVLTAASTALTLVVVVLQLGSAVRAGVPVSWRDVAAELGYPDVEPDETVVYASPEGEDLEVDVYLPPSAPDGGAPAVVLAHAGGFRTFDKSDLRGTGRWLADRGVAVFAIDYRLATAEHPTWDEAPQDLVCALGWVDQNAGRYRVDPQRVSLGGGSAGGVLALGTAYRLADGAIGSSCGGTAPVPRSAIGLYPGTDVREMWESDVQGSREAAAWFTGGTPDEHPERYDEVSPVSYVRAGQVPTLLLVGDRDLSVPDESIRDFGRTLEDAGTPAQVHVLPFAPHAFDDTYGSLSSQTSRQLLLEHLLDS